jgi:ankyrin repeat protein
MIGNAEEGAFYINKALLRASQHGQLVVVSYLLDIGADIEVCDDDGLSPLFLAGQHLEIISMLIDRGAHIMTRSNTYLNYAALHYYASLGQLEGLKLLLNCGCDIHITDNNANTALHYAAKTYDCNVATLLLEHGIDINAKNDDGETALHIAAENDFLELSSMLIDNDIDIEAKTLSLGSTALHVAVRKNNLKLIELMSRRHADVNSKNTAGETALQLAAQASLVHVCSLLIEHGANVNSSDKSRAPPLYSAVKTFDPVVVRLLLDCGASIDKHGSLGDPVSYAIDHANERIGYFDEHKFIAVINLLIKAGVDTTEISLTQESKARFPALETILSTPSDQRLNMKGKNLNPSIALAHDHDEAIDPTEFILKICGHDITNQHGSRYHHLTLSFPIFY